MSSSAQEFTYPSDVNEAWLLDHVKFGPNIIARFGAVILFTLLFASTCKISSYVLRI